MNLKLDENLPRSLCATLTDFGHDVHSVFDEKLTGRPDADIWSAAQREERFLVTQDLDFSDTRKFLPGRHHGILLVRLGSPSRSNFIFRLQQIFENENVENWQGCFVVATERKIRIQRPGGRQP
jgi:predicted nuclease of predicted toxin-antitoxin system